MVVVAAVVELLQQWKVLRLYRFILFLCHFYGELYETFRDFVETISLEYEWPTRTFRCIVGVVTVTIVVCANYFCTQYYASQCRLQLQYEPNTAAERLCTMDIEHTDLELQISPD